MKLLIMKQENVQNKVVGVQNEVATKTTKFFKKYKYVNLEL